MLHIRSLAFLGALALFALCPPLLPQEVQAASLATVDMDHIMLHSRAAAEGRAHLDAVRQRLEQGYADLQAAWHQASKENYDAVMAEGQRALRNQLQLEEKAALDVVNNLILEVVREWRKSHKGLVVVARQNLLDADESLDITQAIVKAMDARKVKFPQLPEIAITKPGDKPASAPTNPQAKDPGHEGSVVRAPVNAPSGKK